MTQVAQVLRKVLFKQIVIEDIICLIHLSCEEAAVFVHYRVL